MDLQKKWINILLIAEVIILIVVGVFGAVGKSNRPADEGYQPVNTGTNNTEADDDSSNEQSISDSISTERVTFSEEVEAKLSEMTLEEKVAQMFLVTPASLTGVANVTVAGETTKNAIQSYPVGGIQILSSNYEDAQQFSSLISGFQEYSQERIGMDMFVGIIETGGEQDSPLAMAGLYELQPSPAELGANGDSSAAGQAAENIAKGISAYGVNMNLALVADVSTGKNVSYDGVTFGSNSGTVSEYVTAQLSGFQNNGVTAVLRSFPGYSYAETGGGAGFFVNSRTLDEMWSSELIVYQAAIDNGAEVIMIANMTAEALTGDSSLPCSFSGATTNLLRNEMGYTGLIMSGDLSTSRITSQFTPEDAAVLAVKAGMDIIQKPVDFVAAYNGVVEAVQSGDIDETLIDNAVGRILTLKFK